MRNKIEYNNFMPYEAEGMRLKLWIVKRIEEELDKLSGGQGGKVATIDFTYNNSWLLDMLRERGDYVKWQEWKKLNQINKEMTRRIHEDSMNVEQAKLNPAEAKPSLADPISAFISMESEESYNNLSAMPEIRLGDGISPISEALEPTNIIWENFDFDNTTRRKRFLMIIGTICFVLFLTFCVTFKAKAATASLTGKYDVSIKCSELSKIYSGPQLSNLAADEWIDYYRHGGEEDERQIAGTLACFCTDQYNANGDDAAAAEFAASDGTMVTTCSEIFSDRAAVVYIKMGVSMMIVGVNFVLRIILVDLIKSLRLRTVTEETNYTMVSIFIGQFVNTGILLTLNSANFKDIDGGNGPLSWIFMVGDLTDFNVQWYRSVGAIIMKTMFMTALWPLIEVAMFWSILNFSRWLDRGFGFDTFVTGMPTVQAYIDLYAGPEYLIHYRYATILLNIGVAFLYGTAMPYLYLCALLAFVILYINERLLVCYYYREPPAFDEKMTLMTLTLTKLVPLIMLPMAFWQLGNRQIFDDRVEEIIYKSDV